MRATRWILAFDGSCCQCRRLAEQVERSGDGRIDIRPLEDPDVRAWRERVLGDEPPHTPTLVRVTGDGAVSAWTGPVMAVRTAARLGARRTLRLLGALGALRKGADGPEAGAGLGRGQFLRLVALGAVGFALGGATQAAAAPLSPARQWVQANRDRLPQDYTAFAAHDIRYRKAIYAASPTSTRSRLWVEHLQGYRAAHPGLSADRAAVVDRAIGAARDESLLANRSTDAGIDARLEGLSEDAVAAFGTDEARALLATLGPVQQGQAAECDCNIFDNFFCWDCQGCISCPCSLCSDCTESGCGPLWTVRCNGVCQ
ncbi:bacteriocin fulvocin C-related protein [Promicromonospora sp. NPDC052451]|uniref:bacteriocin fulvocin C-related protein n=1 Tax=Promicromonospora sp. NPDC052451 TaxID=3364407 RepID=UPI0037CC1BC1